jgi:hypothetical protein
LATKVSRPHPFRVWILGVDEKVYERKVNTREALLARILDAADVIKERRDQVNQYAIITSELQSALVLNVEFSKTYCKLMMC